MQIERENQQTNALNLESQLEAIKPQCSVVSIYSSIEENLIAPVAERNEERGD